MEHAGYCEEDCSRYRRMPTRKRLPSRLYLTALLAAVGLSLQACGEDEPTGPELPIDGQWELVGIFSDSVGFARCWLSGEMTLDRVGGGVNSVEGQGLYTLDCNVFGDQQTFSDTSALADARYQGTSLTLTFGDCSFEATYLPTESSVMTGRASCPIDPTNLGLTDVLGSWEGQRIPEATP